MEELYKSRRYRSVITHQNFNPRLISVITDSERLSECPSDRYWDYIAETLRNPADVWENPFVAQQDDFGRTLVVLVTLNGRPIRQDELAEAYARYVSRAENHAMSGRKDFLLNLRHLTGSLLSRRLTREGALAEPVIDLFNPSIGDFVLRRSVGDLPSLKTAFLSLRSNSSVDTLVALHTNKMISDKAYLEILKALLREANDCAFSGFTVSYVAAIAERVVHAGPLPPEERSSAVNALTFVLDEPIPFSFEDVARVVRWGQETRALSDDRVVRFMVDACEIDSSLSQTELSILDDLRNGLDPGHPELEAVGLRLKARAIDYLQDCIYDEIDDSDVFGDVDYGDDYAARRNVKNLVSDWFGVIGIRCSSSELDAVVDAYDIEERQTKYFEGYGRSYEPRGESPAEVPSDEIDDLFDRS